MLGHRKMPYQRVVRRFKRVARRGVKVAKRALKARYMPRGRLAVGRIVRDVATLRRVINSEKKHYGPTALSYEASNYIAFGLSNGTNAAGGGALIDLSPVAMAKGTNRDQRIGNSIRLSSMVLRCHFTGQSAQSNNSTLRLEVYRVQADTGYTPAAVVWGTLGADLYKADPITSLYPPTASRNPNYMRRFKLLASRTIHTPQDNGGSSNFVRQLMVPIKFTRPEHVRFDDGTNCLTQYILVLRASNGNRSTATASLTGQGMLGLNTAVSTGFLAAITTDFFYYDN